ncbi:dodecin domain-containing protein [Fulvivirgaceae bacterium BMA12]|uniref:Dodecin domain-containing protein n=1 Tax=Agaribacillus aureus TaxID=3051825 RepID=A0ABT8L8W4_9BACT|nr:dodecin domain-containing protein [Fulvivirgaceae bacterium BMA12]
MLANHGVEHQDVIRIIGSSEKSFDEAVQNGISTIREGHAGTPRAELHYVSFEVVQLQGLIKDNGEAPGVSLFQAVLDVVGVHRHEH